MNKNLFTKVQVERPKSNIFDLTHDFKFTCNMGELIPVLYLECVPGDKITLDWETLIKFQPTLAPVMHNIDVTIHAFAVPLRLLWPNWEDWITSYNGETNTAIPQVYLNAIDISEGTLADYLGYPTDIGTNTPVTNCWAFAAYQRIWFDYYRDQNLQSNVLLEQIQLVDGDNDVQADLFILRKRAWEHDYFTSALPFAQKGNAVTLPLINNPFGVAPVRFGFNIPASGNTTLEGTPVDVPITGIDGLDPGLYAEINNEAALITDLRRAFKLQEFLEKNARGGTRYTEIIKMHFGVISSDARLQRAEYICGIKNRVVVSEVLNTTGDALPQGNRSGILNGVAAGGNGFYYAEEHCVIMAIMSVMPQTAYSQGIPKKFLKLDQFDYFWPEFQHIGEQEIKNVEVLASATGPNLTFGYIPRYSEYKYENNRIAGQMKSTFKYWHFGREFVTTPALNEDFIVCDPTRNPFIVTDPEEDTLICHVLNRVKAGRLMSYYGSPRM